MHRPSAPWVAIRLSPAVVASVMALACSASRAPAAPPVVAAAPTARPAVVETNVGVTWSTKASLKLFSPWAVCHQSFTVGTSDPRAEVARLALGCAAVTKMHRVGDPFTGEQKASDNPQTFPWKARSGHCYRAYGVGAPAVKNLDLLMQDSEGTVLGQDGTDDGSPVVLDAGAACFKQDDAASIVVSVGDGSGAFAVEVWED